MKSLRELEKPNAYKSLLRYVAHLQVKHPFLTAGVLLLITFALIGGISQVRTVSSLEQMMPKDVEEIKAFNMLRDAGLGQDMIAVIVSLSDDATLSYAQGGSQIGDIGSFKYYKYVKNLANKLKDNDAVLSVYSFADIIDFSARLNSINTVDELSFKEIMKDPQVKSELSRFVNTDKTNTILIVTTDVSADDTTMKLLAQKIQNDISNFERPAYISLTVTGTPLIQQKLGVVIEHDRSLTEKLSALFVFILVAIVFGSIVAALVPMVTIILSIIWLYGSMGYLGLPISTLAGGVAAMVIGIGVDFSIHLRNKFEYERKKGESLEYAIEETMANTGYVLTITTIVLALAFLSFLIGEMPEMGRFGLLMTIGVTLAFILSVIGLPAFFIIEEKIIEWSRKHMRFGVEHELKLVEIKNKGGKN